MCSTGWHPCALGLSTLVNWLSHAEENRTDPHLQVTLEANRAGFCPLDSQKQVVAKMAGTYSARNPFDAYFDALDALSGHGSDEDRRRARRELNALLGEVRFSQACLCTLHLSQLWHVDVLQSREPAGPGASVGLSLRLHDLTITRNDWKATLANQVARVAGCMPSRQQQRAGQKKVLDKLAIQIPAGRMTAIMVRNW